MKKLKASHKIDVLLVFLVLLQLLLGMRVVFRLLRSVGGERISSSEGATPAISDEESVTVIVPVLNEYDRLSPCLEGLMAQGKEVAEIVVVDGGSSDGTQRLVHAYERRDSRIRLLDASPIPSSWNGKAWGLHVGLRAAHVCSSWILTVDADVRPLEALTRALLARAKRERLPALSIATLQEIAGVGEGLLHPSLLTTLVYRFGLPGKIIRRVSDVQANGQCFLFRRDVLEACDGFANARHSICEDITIARTLVAKEFPLGFYEAGELVTVKMYRDWRDTWGNWTRSLPMHDHFSGMSTLLGWLEIALVQALPLPLFLLLTMRHVRYRWFIALNGFLATMRIGILFGTMRAYRHRPWSYWLSPLCDLPVVLKLGISALRRRHTWRGRVLLRGGKE